MTDRSRLEALLAAGHDDALLRFALGNLMMKNGEFAQAAAHFQRATELDPGYSAAWKNWGRCLASGGREDAARSTLRQAIDVARARGDKQAEREAAVFLKRLGGTEPG